MHDPQTRIGELKVFGRTIATLWHVDPEHGGSDDSCGWFAPRLDDRDQRLAVDLEREGRFYWFEAPARIRDARYMFFEIGPGDCAMICLALWARIAWIEQRRRLRPRESLAAMSLGFNPDDNLQSVFATPPHESLKTHERERAIRCVIRAYRRFHRPWWRHPRWHVWHWRIRFDGWSRWRLGRQRCEGCSQRLGKGSLTTDGRAYWHSRCYPSQVVDTAKRPG